MKSWISGLGYRIAEIITSSRRRHKICKMFVSDSQALCGWAVVVVVGRRLLQFRQPAARQ